MAMARTKAVGLAKAKKKAAATEDEEEEDDLPPARSKKVSKLAPKRKAIEAEEAEDEDDFDEPEDDVEDEDDEDDDVKNGEDDANDAAAAAAEDAEEDEEEDEPAPRSKKRSAVTIVQSGKTGLPATLQDQMQRLIKKAKANLVAGGEGNLISTDRDGTMSLNGSEIGTEFEAVILGYAHMNEYYAKDYNAKAKKDGPAWPDCYAISEEPGDMVPAENAPDPQSDECGNCTWAEFGTKGAGRKCSQRMRLILVSLQDLDELEEAPLYTLRTTPTGGRHFQRYATNLANKEVPVEWVVTRIYTEEDEKANGAHVHMFEVAVNDKGKAMTLNEDTISALMARKEEATNVATALLPITEGGAKDDEEEEAPRKKVKKKSKFG